MTFGNNENLFFILRSLVHDHDMDLQNDNTKMISVGRQEVLNTHIALIYLFAHL